MVNPEEQLLDSLANAVGAVYRGGRAFADPANPTGPMIQPGQRWPAGNPAAWKGDAFAGYHAGELRGSSANWDGDSAACAILLGNPAEQAQADGDGIALLTEQRDKLGWMGPELLSTVYWLMHLYYALAFVRQGSAALRELAWQWLDLARFVLVTTWDGRVGRCLWYGERSAEEGRDGPGYADKLAAWLAGAGPFPSGNDRDALILQGFRAELEVLKARPLANPAWKTQDPVTLYVGDDGKAICSGPERDHNTPKVCCGTTVGAAVGQVRLGPPGPYLSRVREQDTGGNAVESADGKSLVYTSRMPKVFPAVTLPVPVNAKRYRLGSGSTEPIGAASPAPGPTGPTPLPASQAPHPSGGHTGCLIPVALVLGAGAAAAVLMVALS